MSFIHLSTVQPTDGQEEVTSRHPSLVKNDFRNGILIQKGETIELVGLRLAFTGIEIIHGVNDTFFYQLGDAPNFCQLQCKIEPKVYDAEELAQAIARSMELAMNLPSFNDLETPTGDFGNSGVTVTYTPATATDNAKYTITLNQMDNNEVADHTLNEMGASQGASFDDITFCPRSGINDDSMIGIVNGGYQIANPNDEGNSPSLLSNSTLASKAHGMTEGTDIFPPTFDDVIASNFQKDVLNQGLSTQCMVQSGAPVEGTADGLVDDEVQLVGEPELIESVIDVGGRVCLGFAPGQGYQLASLRSAISNVNMTLIYDAETGASVDGTVTLENGGGASNFWEFRFDVVGQDTIPSEDGTNRNLTRLYGTFSEGLTTTGGGLFETGGLFWGVGTGADGTGGPPADANDFANHTWKQEAIGAEGLDMSRWYYDFRGCDGDLDFKCQLYQIEGGQQYWRINWETDGVSHSAVQDPSNITTPCFFRTDGQTINIPPDRVLGYNAGRVGLNRRIREVKDGMLELNYSDPMRPSRDGQGSIAGGGEHELQDYWIGIKNQKSDGTQRVTQTGALMPVVEVCVPQPFEGAPLYPDRRNIVSQVIIEEFIDDIQGAPQINFDQDLWLQVKVDNMNQLSFGLGQKASQDPRKANLVAPIAPANANFTTISSTGNNQGDAPTQIKQSDYPLIGSILVGRGALYPPKNTVNQASMDELGVYYMVDCAVAQRDSNIVLDGRGRKALTAEPIPFKKKSFIDAPTLSGNKFNLKQMFKFGRVRRSEETFRVTPAQQDPNQTQYYENRESDKVLGEFIDEHNNASIERMLGMPTLININTPRVADGTQSIESSLQVRTHPITDVFSVELLSEPVSSSNGAVGDKGKAIYTLSAEELEVDSVNRVITYTPKTRLPVDMNVAQDKTVYSLTCAIKDVNNRLVQGLRPPTDITLFKSLPEGTKIARAVQELKDVMSGKANDKNANEIDNIGVHNPILGVIPK